MKIKSILKKTPLYGIVRHFRGDKHERKMLAFYSQFVSPGELVFDVGANAGNRTKIFLKRGAKVVAIEPQDDCVHTLRTRYGNNKNLTIIQKVLGASEGEAELMISSANVLSSLSQEWIESVKSSGRFSDHTWQDKKVVPMTTLDRLIDDYGVPSFIKIDVEGFEHQVIQGLSKPVREISLEFTPECMDSTFACIEYFKSLGEARFNYSIGESMQLALGSYVPSAEMVRILEGYQQDHKLFGDVYCRFTGALNSGG